MLALRGYLQVAKIPKLGKADRRTLLMEEKFIFPEGKPPSRPRRFPWGDNFSDKPILLIHRKFFPIYGVDPVSAYCIITQANPFRKLAIPR